jgi:hypothetical protein
MTSHPRPREISNSMLVFCHDCGFIWESTCLTILIFQTGDIIEILEIGEDEWYTGRTKDGAIGVFPSNYVRIT